MSHINSLTGQIFTVFQAESDNFTKVKPLPLPKAFGPDWAGPDAMRSFKTLCQCAAKFYRIAFLALSFVIQGVFLRDQGRILLQLLRI